MLNTAPHVHGLMQRLKPLILLAGLVLAFAATWLSAPNDAAAQDPIDQIKQLYKDGLSQYDFFEYEKANAKYDEAIEIAKTNDVKDPVVAKVYLAKGILFHAQFKDTAPEVAYDKTRDTFISAVSFDYDIEIPEDYYTEELDEILKDARSVVPPPDGDGQDGGDGDGDGGTTTSGDVAVQHTDIGVADACTELEVVANVPPHPDVYRVYVHYRDPEGVSWETLELEPGDDPERFAATLSPKTMVGPKLSYYIEVVNRQRAAVATSPSSASACSSPKRFRSCTSSCLQAPASDSPTAMPSAAPRRPSATATTRSASTASSQVSRQRRSTRTSSSCSTSSRSCSSASTDASRSSSSAT